MTTLICNGTGNFTGASTFAGAEVGALALVLNRNTTTAIGAATTATSVTFTVTNAKVIDAVLLWLNVTAASPTGTFKVDLQKGGVSQASVTVNKADLPDSTNATTVPVLFKLTTTATGDGGSNWTIVITTTGNGTVTASIASATTTNFTRALRTTTAATPAAADDLYVIGELTGAGTHTSYTVTMNQTATTAYGNGALNSTTVAGGLIAVSSYGTLTYGVTASTNYVLRVNGDLIVYQFGTFHMGASGAEVPRNSTAVLEFQQLSASGDFGLRLLDNCTVTTAGLSRTSGKNIVSCKANVDIGAAFLISGAFSGTAMGIATSVLDSTGLSLLGTAATETSANSVHMLGQSLNTGSITNVTQTVAVWLARGSGTHNRFVRLQLGNFASASVTNGCIVDIDLQAGTIGSATAVGNGTGTSSSITAVAGGFYCTMTGKASSSALTPIVSIMGCSAAGTVSYTGDSTQNFIYDKFNVFTGSAPSLTYGVDTDTGWLSGDAVAIASTTRTPGDCETLVLGSNAGSTSIAGGTSLLTTHSGTSPAQAEIILLTRNVKIRSTSNTLLSYVYATALANVTMSWTQMYYLGLSTTNKRGLEIDGGATATAKSITFCSVHDGNIGLQIASISQVSVNLTFSSNGIWNTSSNFMNISGSITNTDVTVDSCVFMKAGTVGFNLSDNSWTLTNTAVIASTTGITVSETSANLGTWTGNTVHSTSGVGLNFGVAIVPNSTLSNWSIWRCGGVGMQFVATNLNDNLVFDGLTMFGNTTSNINFSGTGVIINLTIKNGSLTGDTTFSTTSNFAIGTSSAIDLLLDTVDTSASSGIKAICTNDFFYNFGSPFPYKLQVVGRNSIFGATNLLGGTNVRSCLTANSFLSFEKYGQTAGDHRTEMPFGQLKTDTSIFNTATPAMRMTPNSASNKLQSAPIHKGMLSPVNSGSTVSVSVYVRKSAVGDGTAYTGNQPRLIQRANPALGQTNDVVLATYSAGTGAWNQLTATSSSATDDGAWEFIVDCDGTVGWVNVDDWAAS